MAVGPLLVAAASAPVTEMDPDVDTARTVGDIDQVTHIRTVQGEGVERVVLARSGSVSDETNAEDLLETADPTPRDPYAKSEIAVELVCHESILTTICRRLATDRGWSSGIRFDLVIDDFICRALHDEPLTGYGDWTDWRPFSYVRDSARSFTGALSRYPGVRNLKEANLRLENVMTAISDAVGRFVETTYLEDGDFGPSFQFDVSKMRGQGFMPETGFLGGIKQLVERFRPRRTAGEVHG